MNVESSGIFQRHTSGQSSSHDGHNTTPSSNPSGPLDLEKAETAEDALDARPGTLRATSTGRISRSQSLARRRTVFNHPLSHVKTSTNVIVDFEGPDDPYRPINWPFRKKVVTTMLYGFTTMGATWSTSVYVGGHLYLGRSADQIT